MAEEKEKDKEKDKKSKPEGEKAEKGKENGEGKAGDEKKGGKKKAIIIGSIIFVVLVLQVGSAYFIVNALKGQNIEEAANEKREEEKKEMLEKMTRIGAELEEPISVTINVAGEGNHYLKTAIQLEWDEAQHQELRLRLGERMTKIKNIIIDILTTKSLSDLTTSAGKKRIQEEIRGEVNAIIPPDQGQVSNVYFTEFLVQ